MQADALLLRDFGGPDQLKLARVAVHPGPTEALVRVLACGVNYFDVDVRRGRSRRPIGLPLVMGREVVGIVEEPAADGTGPPAGTQVTVLYTIACHQCQPCRAGRDHFCASLELVGATRWGGYATHMSAPTRALIQIPDQADPVTVAAGQISYSTAIHSLLARGNLLPGERVMITGATGGVGSAVIDIALQHGATVVAAVGKAEKAGTAVALGAHEVLLLHGSQLHMFPERREHIEPVQLVIDTAGGDYFRASMEHMSEGGRAVIVGAQGGEQVPMDLVKLYQSEHAIIGTARATRNELEETITGIATGRYSPYITHTVGLTGVRSVHDLMEDRALTGKAVVVPTD